MPTHHEGTPEEVRALNAYVTLVRAAESVTARTLPAMAELDLTIGQFGSLEALYHLGAMGQKELAAKLLRTSGNVTMVVDNLEKRGLVRRERDADDRRRSTVHLTPEGRKLIAKAFPRVLASIVEEMSTLGRSEQEALRRLCRKLGRKET